MRISDWSSDVCSSDLRLQGIGVHVAGAIGRRQRGSGDGAGDAGHAELGADLPMRARSEEHTSELQSLMRISYAVFCLKKKKKPKCIHNNKPPYKMTPHTSTPYTNLTHNTNSTMTTDNK